MARYHNPSRRERICSDTVKKFYINLNEKYMRIALFICDLTILQSILVGYTEILIANCVRIY